MSEEKVSTTQDLKVQKQTKRDRRYLINIIVILLITFGYTTYSLWNELPAVINVFRGTEADYRMIIIIIVLIALKFLLKALSYLFLLGFIPRLIKYIAVSRMLLLVNFIMILLRVLQVVNLRR